MPRAFPSSRFRPALLATLIVMASSQAAFARTPPRIVSLIPSLTEDLFAIGAGPQVVAVSQFTDYPAAAKKLPQVASFSSLDAERIAVLHPDLVVGIPAQATLVMDLRRLGLRVELLPDDSFDQLFVTLARLGSLSGHAREAESLAAAMRARTATLQKTVVGRDRPGIFVVLGVDPIFTIGTGSYIARLIELAGGRNASGLGVPYARYSSEALLARQPDAIVADVPSGLRGVLARAPWRDLRAVRAKRVYVLDDAAILERPGPRYNDGLAWLIARIHNGGATSRR